MPERHGTQRGKVVAPTESFIDEKESRSAYGLQSNPLNCYVMAGSEIARPASGSPRMIKESRNAAFANQTDDHGGRFER
jgi:hypothetical protein